MEQRTTVKSCFLSGKTPAETLVLLQIVYGSNALSKTRVYYWFSRFKKGDMSIEDQPRSGRPSTSRTEENVKKINSLVREDRRRTIDQLSEMSGVSWSSIQRILAKDLHMRRIADKHVPRLHTDRERPLQAMTTAEKKRRYREKREKVGLRPQRRKKIRDITNDGKQDICNNRTLDIYPTSPRSESSDENGSMDWEIEETKFSMQLPDVVNLPSSQPEAIKTPQEPSIKHSVAALQRLEGDLSTASVQNVVGAVAPKIEPAEPSSNVFIKIEDRYEQSSDKSPTNTTTIAENIAPNRTPFDNSHIQDDDYNFFMSILPQFRKLKAPDKAMIKAQIKQLVAWKLKAVTSSNK